MISFRALICAICLCLFPSIAYAQFLKKSKDTSITKTAEDLHWDAINRHRDGVERGGNFIYDYATCANVFPLDVAKGREIVLSGYIKTDDLKEGWAGLWWHTDRRYNLYDISNMQMNGPHGTTDWTYFSIKVHVKKEAISTDFGCVMSGKGTAWFDKLEVEIDGMTYKEFPILTSKDTNYIKEPFLNLDFEAPPINKDAIVWSLNGGGDYIVVIDSTVKYSGKYSLRIGPKPHPPKIDSNNLPDPIVELPKPTEIPHVVTDSIKMYLRQSSSSAIVYFETPAKINVSVLNADKKVLLHKDDVKSVDISALSNGIYNIEVYNETGALLKSGKVLKE